MCDTGKHEAERADDGCDGEHSPITEATYDPIIDRAEYEVERDAEGRDPRELVHLTNVDVFVVIIEKHTLRVIDAITKETNSEFFLTRDAFLFVTHTANMPYIDKQFPFVSQSMQ